MPPTEDVLSAKELWDQIMAMPRPHRLVPFPRKGEDGKPLGQVAMIILTQEESGRAIAAAEAWTRRVLKEEKQLPQAGEPRTGYEELLENRKALEILFRCCKQPEDLSKGFFPAVEVIGQKLTVDEVAILILNYIRVKSELGPVDSEMGPEEREAWIEKLAKGGSLYPFDSLSLGAQSQLITYMASQLYSSRMASSSPGLPREGLTSS